MKEVFYKPEHVHRGRMLQQIIRGKNKTERKYQLFIQTLKYGLLTTVRTLIPMHLMRISSGDALAG